MDIFRFDPPSLSEPELRTILADLYGSNIGVDSTLSPLRGERSHNTKVTTGDGVEFVLRVASASEPEPAIDLPTRALLHLQRTVPELPVARPIASVEGDFVPAVSRQGVVHRVRFETFLPGMTFDDEQSLSLGGLRAIGSLLGRVAAALATFNHPAADGFLAWDVANRLILDASLTSSLATDTRRLVDRARPRLEHVASVYDTLPRQVIHNDGHAGNLLRPGADSETVSGVIDFGDLVRTVRVADLAVSGASLVPHQADPVASLGALTAGYHAQVGLTVDELAAVPDAVLSRLVLSTLLIQYQVDHAPHLAAIVAPELDWTVTNLERWLDIDVTTAQRAIEEAL